MCAASSSVALDQRSAHLRIALGRFELARHSGEEPVEDQLLLDPNHGVVRAGHADVGLISRAAGQDALVGGGNVGVGAEDGGDAAIEIPAHGDLLAGSLGVQVEHDDLGRDLREQLVGLAEGIVAGGHEDAALKVQDGVALSIAKLALVDAETRRPGGVVGRADNAAVAVARIGRDRHVLEDLFFVPDVVAGGDDMRAEVEELFGDGGRDSEASSGVFAVDDQ